MLFNIASAAERSRRDQVALDAYQRYLQAVPDAPNRDLTERRIAFLRAQIASGSSPTPGPGPASSGGGDAGPVPWVLVGVGAAVAVVGGVLLGVGLADQSTVENPPDGARWEDSAPAYDRGPALLTTSVIALPLGVALAAAGVVWAIVGSDSGESASLRFGPDRVVLTGTF